MSTHALSPIDSSKFEEDGYAGPFELMGFAAMRERAVNIIEQALGSSGPNGLSCCESRHQDLSDLYDICASPQIVEKVSSILGGDVLLWNSVLFVKDPGGGEIPWHQDQEFLLLNPCVNVAAWVALTETTTENGCLDVIPGSHKRQIPHVPRRHSYEFVARAELQHVDREKAIRLEFQPGQFILFHTNLLHHSGANFSTRRRVGLAIRYTIPGVKIFAEGLFKDHRVYVVQGSDNQRVNRIGIPPRSRV